MHKQKHRALVSDTHCVGLNTSMSSSSLDPCEPLPWVLVRTFRTRPSSEPRNTTVRFLWGPAVVSTTIWVSLYLHNTNSWEWWQNHMVSVCVRVCVVPAGGVGDQWLAVDWRHRLVHQWVCLNEWQHRVWELNRGRERGRWTFTCTQTWTEHTQKHRPVLFYYHWYSFC